MRKKGEYREKITATNVAPVFCQGIEGCKLMYIPQADNAENCTPPCWSRFDFQLHDSEGRCTAEFETRAALLNHLRSIHQVTTLSLAVTVTNQCPVCLEILSNRTTAFRYLGGALCMSRATSLAELAVPPSLTCRLCGHESASLESFQVHAREHLPFPGSIRPGVVAAMSDVELDDLGPILKGGQFPELKHLGLANAEFTNELCSLLPDSPILSQLKVLDLSMGCMDDHGARALTTSPERLRHLDLLNVRENFLSKDGIDRLAKLGCRVLADDQRDVDDSTNEALRYVAAGE